MELVDFLKDVVTDARVDLDIRQRAGKLLAQWNAGLVPAPREVRALRKSLEKVETCARMQTDGSCPWLRKNAKSEGLRPPRPGQRAYCKRRATGKAANTFAECPGYRKEQFQ